MAERFEEIEIKGRRALFTDSRIGEVPDGFVKYDLRHGDDDGEPCSIEERVIVNYYGSILVTEPFDFNGKDYIPLGYEDFGFTGESMIPEEFLAAE